MSAQASAAAAQPALSRADGVLDLNHDIDRFGLDSQPGLRYFVELLISPSQDSSAFLAFSLEDSQGRIVRSASLGVGPGYRDSSAFVFAGPLVGPVELAVSAVWGLDASLAYALQVVGVAADDYADVHASAGLISANSVHSGSFDLPGDTDCFALDLAAGQHVLFDVAGQGSGPLSYRARLYDASDQELPVYAFSSASKLQLGFTAQQAGRYVLDLRSTATQGKPGDPALGSYTLQVATLPADDHADARDGASLMLIDLATPLRLDHAGDIDWLRIDLAAGQRYVFALGLANGATPGNGFKLSLFDASGQVLQDSNGASLVFEAQAAGAYFVRALSGTTVAAVRGAPLDYVLTATRSAQADTGGAAWNAAPLSLGQAISASHLGPGDDDVFSFDAVAGQRYVLDYSRPGSALDGSAIYFATGTDLRPIDLAPQQRDAGSAQLRMVFEAPASGTAYVVVRPPQGQVLAPTATLTYQLLLSAAPADDHGDGRGTATPLQAETWAVAQDESGESDLFRVELVAGQRYRFDVQPATAMVAADQLGLSLFGAVGAFALAEVSFGSTLAFTPESSGRFYFRPEGPGAVRVSFHTVAADDHGDLGFTPIGAATEFNASGLLLTGDAHANRLFGGTRADRLSGQGGDDQLWGGAGNDQLDGGAGIDTAHFVGARSDYDILFAAGVGTVQVKAGDAGVDQLTGIERLQFDGQTVRLAMDLDGNAGSVAKIIGALFGKARLADAAIVGIGLKLLDDGMSYPDLVAAAVASGFFEQSAGSHSNTDFVRWVYSNVVGAPPAAADLKYYVDLLETGAYTQATLGLLACEIELNVAGVDLIGLAGTGLPFIPG